MTTYPELKLFIGGQWKSADGTPVPVYDEVHQIGDEFAKAGSALAGTAPHADVALVNDYDSRWAISFQRHSADFDPVIFRQALEGD